MPRAELRGDDDQQREARRAVGHPGGDQADRLEREELGELELERAGVLAPVGVEVEVAAARDDAGVERQADAVRRLEAGVECRRAEVAATGREGQVGLHAHPVDDRRSGPRPAEKLVDSSTRTDSF